MDTKALRQKILDLAIHGRLVPQDPTDEPASALLQRIREEKLRLAPKGIMKKKSKGSEETVQAKDAPFEVPEGWVWTRVGEIFMFIRNGAQIRQDKSNKGLPITRIESISMGILDRTRMGYANITDDTFYSYYLQTNDILLSHINSAIHVGKSALCKIDEGEKIIHGMNLLCLRPFKYLDAEYINLYFGSDVFKSAIRPYVKNAVNQASLNIANLSSTLFPLPPLAEQHRIVAEIERWFGLIDIVERGKESLKSAVQSAKSKILDLAIHGRLVPQDATDEPASALLHRINPQAKMVADNDEYGDVPKGWCVTRVKDVFIINPKNKEKDEVLAGFVPMTNISEGFSNHFVYEVKNWGSIKTGFTHFSDGDIAVAKISPCLENRKSIVLKDLPNGIGAGTTELHVLRPLGLLNTYGLYFFKSDYFIKQCVGTFNGVVGQQRVGKNIVEQIPFPLPPLAEQHRIVTRIEELFAQLDRIEEALG